MIYDGECPFCTFWIERWKKLTGELVEYAPYQDVAPRYRDISLDEFGRSVHLVHPDGRTSRGARAVFESLSQANKAAWLLTWYHHLPGFGPLSEMVYRFVASHRDALYRLTRLFVRSV